MSLTASKAQQLSLRSASTADIAALAALEAAYYETEGYPEALFFQALHQWPQLLQVAVSEQEVAGYCLGAPGGEPHSLWLMSLLVSAKQRGKGIGVKLLKHWLAIAEQLGYQTIQLSVAPENHAAIELYRQNGFVEQGLQQDYLGAGQHRLLMTRQALTCC
ncbi:GNAT family N-acetyltransferase [Pseudidiomarina terrestris]|uniref:GNAT family N-acetyltransferase n=1 Tax=Pseudidiomarina terrestris TaxID=2820060 RepID=UPI00264B2853|nr:N-acetyltransferase [Pseudidiomarina sp. 1ASP75-5]MDN7135399.1 GNAT family N-acetyltransferase [Pseudidiomarina sp. 1ASP75-5]